MYLLVIEVVKVTFPSPTLGHVIERELDRQFRSQYFKSEFDLKFIDPIDMQFVLSYENHSQQRGLDRNEERKAKLEGKQASKKDSKMPDYHQLLYDRFSQMNGPMGLDDFSRKASAASSRARSAPKSATPSISIDTPAAKRPDSSQNSVRSVNVTSTRPPSTRSNESARPSINGSRGTSASSHAEEELKKKKISINVVRMIRSPLADECLPPPQRFLFIQTRPEAVSNAVG